MLPDGTKIKMQCIKLYDFKTIPKLRSWRKLFSPDGVQKLTLLRRSFLTNLSGEEAQTPKSLHIDKIILNMKGKDVLVTLVGDGERVRKEEIEIEPGIISKLDCVFSTKILPLTS